MNVCDETLAVLPRTWATVVQVVPSAETCRSKSRVFHDVLSPPAPAWRRVTDLTAVAAPRSTCRYFVAAVEQNLSLVPPETLPLTALAGPSLALQAADPVAGRFSARFGDGGADVL